MNLKYLVLFLLLTLNFNVQNKSMAETEIESDSYSKIHIGDIAPNFTVKTTTEQELSLASLKGQVVLLNFFTTW